MPTETTAERIRRQQREYNEWFWDKVADLVIGERTPE